MLIILFVDATTVVLAARYPTLSIVLLLLDGIIDVLKAVVTADSIPGLRTALQREVEDCFAYVRSCDIYYVATEIDPRYKMIPFTEDWRSIQAHNLLIAAMERALLRQAHDSAYGSQSQQHEARSGSVPQQSHVTLRSLNCQPADGLRSKS